MAIPFINLKEQYSRNKANIDAAIHRVLEHGQYIMGPEIVELEKQLANYIGCKHALACSNGTDALTLPLMSKELCRSDAIFTTPFTFFASAEAITLAGATPVFVDIDPNTYNINPELLKLSIQNVLDEGQLRPKGILPVDLFGLAADYDSINAIAQEFGLFVLEDAAQAFGAKYKDRKAGGLADVASTSFYPAKPLGCYGDGGAVFTNDSNLYNELVSLRVHGQATSGNKYDNTRIGMNARMDTIQAAILLEKIKSYDAELVQRNRVAECYSQTLSSNIVTPTVPDNQESVWAQYSIQVNDRAKLQNDLKKIGIPTAVFYPIPIHLSTAYQSLGYSSGDFPVTEEISHKIVSLPMHPFLETEEVISIADAVNASIGG